MKKLLLLALIALIMVGCLDKRDSNNIPYKIVVIDSCEYINDGSFTVVGHKGNCRFCKERRKKEYTEIIDSLFNMQE